MFTSDQTPASQYPHLQDQHAALMDAGGKLSTSQTETFDRALIGSLPRLRIYALSLTRNPDRADELVQQTALKALAGRKSFSPGTNFAAWLFRIQRNEFVAEFRRNRLAIDIHKDVVDTAASPPTQEIGLTLREFLGAFRKLSRPTRQVLLLAQVEGLTYQEISENSGVSAGTLKSRVCRGRATLADLLDRSVLPAVPLGRRLGQTSGPAASNGAVG